MKVTFKYLFCLSLFLASIQSIADSLSLDNQIVDRCEIMVFMPEGGSTTIFPRVYFRATNLTDTKGKFELSPSMPDNISTIKCERESIIPLKNDYKIPLTGLEFIIMTYKPHKIVQFDTVDNKLQYRLVRGEISSEEQLELAKYIATVKGFF